MRLPRRFESPVGVYRITCLANGLIYVGSSCQLRGRGNEHLSHLRRGVHGNAHLQHAWSKYGADQFVFEVLEYCTKEDQVEREQWYIDTLRAAERSVGFNVCARAMSRSGVSLSEEAKRKISAANTGRVKSEETIQRMRDAWVENHAEWRQNAIDQRGIEFEIVSPQGVLHKVKGLKRFAQEHGLDRAQLTRVVFRQGRTRTVRGWHLPGHQGRPPYRFVDPAGNLHVIPFGTLKTFCGQHDLNRRMQEVAAGSLEEYKGWKRAA